MNSIQASPGEASLTALRGGKAAMALPRAFTFLNHLEERFDSYQGTNLDLMYSSLLDFDLLSS